MFCRQLFTQTFCWPYSFELTFLVFFVLFYFIFVLCFFFFVLLVALRCLFIVLVHRLFSASWFGFSIRFPVGKRLLFRCKIWPALWFSLGFHTSFGNFEPLIKISNFTFHILDMNEVYVIFNKEL